jgi:hypothetical protein
MHFRRLLVWVLFLISVPLFAQGNGASPLIVGSAKADNAMIVLHLEGQSFCSAPVVKLNGASLTLASTTPPNVIEAMLPAGIAAGSYLLTVSCGNGSPQTIRST